MMDLCLTLCSVKHFAFEASVQREKGGRYSRRQGAHSPPEETHLVCSCMYLSGTKCRKPLVILNPITSDSVKENTFRREESLCGRGLGMCRPGSQSLGRDGPLLQGAPGSWVLQCVQLCLKGLQCQRLSSVDQETVVETGVGRGLAEPVYCLPCHLTWHREEEDVIPNRQLCQATVPRAPL